MQTTQSYAERVRSGRDSEFWRIWALRTLLFLGGVHLLAGVIFFFAYNWDELSAYAKFGLLQAAIVVSFVGALFARFDRPLGQGLLIATSVFTGVLLAVIGQVYQTGADAWQLFAAWVVLIFPWVAVSRSSLHVFLWIVLLLTTVTLYGEQRLVALGHIDRQQLVTLVGLITVAFLLFLEIGIHAGAVWLSTDWMRRVLVTISLFSLIAPALDFVFDSSPSAFPGFIVFVGLIFSLGWIYSKGLRDYAVVAIAVAFATVFCIAAGGHFIFEWFEFGSDLGSLVLPLLLLAGWCVLLTSVTVRLLRGIHATMDADAGDD